MAMKLRGFLEANGDGSERENGTECSTAPAISELDTTNSEVRFQVGMVVDGSDSMSLSMPELNEHLASFIAHVQDDDFLSKSVEIAIIRVGGFEAELLLPFSPPPAIALPTLHAGGKTPLYGGIQLAANEIESRRQLYRSKGIDWKKAMVIVLTDGKPTDSEEEMAAARVISQYENARTKRDRIGFFIFGMSGADLTRLNKITPRGVMPANKQRLKSILDWLKASLDVLLASAPDADMMLPDPRNFGLL